MSSRDDDDLFGDGDCGDSLFGDDHDSLFDGSDGDEEEKAVPPCSSTVDATSGCATNGLSFPSVPDPHDALSRSHVGHTSGQQTVSTQDPSGNAWGLPMPETTGSQTAVDAQVFRDPAIDTFPVAGLTHGGQAFYAQPGEAAPQFPGRSVSKERLMQEVERMFDKGFAEGQDDRVQPGDPHVPSEAVCEDTQLIENDNKMLMEYNTLRDQAARSTTTALGDPPADIGISLADTNHRYADARSRRGIRLPRRIDFDGADLDVLRPYLTLNRGDSAAMHFERLELPGKLGKALHKDLKDYVWLSPDAEHLKQRGTKLDTDERRSMFLTAALRVLKTEGWGAKWFGPFSPEGSTRKLVWPTDSTLLVMRFAGFLYKIADQAKYRKCNLKTPGKKASRQSTESQQPSEGQSQSMPIDLTSDDHGSTGVFRALTPNTSVCSSRPSSSHMSFRHASTGDISLGDQHSQDASRRTSLVLPVYKSPAFNAANPDLRPDFFIMEDPPMPEDGSATLSGAGNPAVAPIRTGITLAMLAEQVADLKQRKTKKPSEPPRPVVRYRFAFTDAADAQDLRAPVVGVLADEIVEGDRAVRTIRKAFSRAGVPAAIHVRTGEGQDSVEVTTQEEWNEAVQAVWARHGDGAVVDVGIRV